MQVTIVPEDGFVSEDGYGYRGMVFDIDPAIHAVQWYGTWGEVEYKVLLDGISNIKPPNRIVTELHEYQPALDAWQSAHDAAAIAQALSMGSITINADALSI